ncbi:hypothetical protein ACN20G_24175 [Streptomyces sp. BI20]|uniref:hypothetical protein n=1 Tax=Streptomyces sp. BI20 TaxID=3403460 RepID=UPI003C7503B9
MTPQSARPQSLPSAGSLSETLPDGGAAQTPVVIEAPALAALRAAPARAAASASASAEAAAPADPAASEGPAADGVEVPEPEPGEVGPAAGPDGVVMPPVPDIPEPRVPAAAGAGAEEQVREVPREVMEELPVRPADVCALGRRSGHWDADSPEARICADVEGG